MFYREVDKYGLVPVIENNEIRITDSGKSPEEFEQAVGRMICFLLKEDYQCEAHIANGNVIITYNYNNKPYDKIDNCVDRLKWISYEEDEAITNKRRQVSIDFINNSSKSQ